jgi:hypothetical protein
MKNKLVIAFALLFFSTSMFAQQDKVKFKTLAESLFENEMLTYRFYKDYLLIKANINKKKAFADLDKSMARFDDNLSNIDNYFSDEDVRSDIEELQNYWNLHRVALLNFEDENYSLQISKLQNLDKLMIKLIEKVIKNVDLFDENDDVVEILKMTTQNIRQSDKIIIKYLLDKKFHQKASEEIDVDLSRVKKNLKKIAKYNKHQFSSKIDDLVININSVETLLEDDTFHPKMIMSNASVFSKKNYLIFSKLINSLKN